VTEGGVRAIHATTYKLYFEANERLRTTLTTENNPSFSRFSWSLITASDDVVVERFSKGMYGVQSHIFSSLHVHTHI